LVVALVARGLTNRQIASELSISERTVDTHVARVLKKLALHSREQVAGWIEERRGALPARTARRGARDSERGYGSRR